MGDLEDNFVSEAELIKKGAKPMPNFAGYLVLQTQEAEEIYEPVRDKEGNSRLYNRRH